MSCNLIVPLHDNMIQNVKMEAASLFETCVTIYRHGVISEKIRGYKSKCMIRRVKESLLECTLEC